MKPGTLYLLPAFLGENNLNVIPAETIQLLDKLNVFIVEDKRTARRTLRAMGYKKNFDTEVVMHELDKHAKGQSCRQLLQEVLNGADAGLMSEAGNPCIADPGYQVVAYAHRQQINVCPLVGPSSILLALIASGFNGQQFCFHGYLPVREAERIQKIKQLENAALSGVTQLFMETPFRNQPLFESLLKTCKPTTPLCVACDLTLPTQFIRTFKISEWQQQVPNLHKRYVVFALGR